MEGVELWWEVVDSVGSVEPDQRGGEGLNFSARPRDPLLGQACAAFTMGKGYSVTICYFEAVRPEHRSVPLFLKRQPCTS